MPSLVDPAKLAAWVLHDKTSASSGPFKSKSQKKREAAARKKARQATTTSRAPSLPASTGAPSAAPTQQAVTSTEEPLVEEEQDHDVPEQSFKISCDFDDECVLTMIHEDGSRSQLSDVVALHPNVPAFTISASDDYDAERAYEWLQWVFYPGSFNSDEEHLDLVPISISDIVNARHTNQDDEIAIDRVLGLLSDTESKLMPLSKTRHRNQRRALKKKFKTIERTQLSSLECKRTSSLPLKFGFTQMTPSSMLGSPDVPTPTSNGAFTFNFSSTKELPFFCTSGNPVSMTSGDVSRLASPRTRKDQNARNMESGRIAKASKDISARFQNIKASFGDKLAQVQGCALPPLAENHSGEAHPAAHFKRVKLFNAMCAQEEKYIAHLATISKNFTAWLTSEHALAVNQHRLYRMAERAQLKMTMCGGPVSIFASAVEALDTAKAFFAPRLTEYANVHMVLPGQAPAIQTWEDFMEEASAGFFDCKRGNIIAFDDLDVDNSALSSIEGTLAQPDAGNAKEYVSSKTVAQINEVLRTKEALVVGPKLIQPLISNAMLPLLDGSEIAAKIDRAAEQERLFRRTNIVLHIRVPQGVYPPTEAYQKTVDFEEALVTALSDIKHLADIEEQQADAIMLQNATVPVQHEDSYAEDYILQLYGRTTFDCANSTDISETIMNEPFGPLSAKKNNNESVPVCSYRLPCGFLRMAPEVRSSLVPYAHPAESSCWLSNNPYQKVVGSIDVAVIATNTNPPQDPEAMSMTPAPPVEAVVESCPESPSASGSSSRSSSPRHALHLGRSVTPLTDVTEDQVASVAPAANGPSFMSNEKYAQILADEVYGYNSLSGNSFPPPIQEALASKSVGSVNVANHETSKESEQCHDPVFYDTSAEAGGVKVGGISMIEYVDTINALNTAEDSVSVDIAATAFVKLVKQQYAEMSNGKLSLPVSIESDKIRELLGFKLLKEIIRLGDISLHEFLGLLKCDENGDTTGEAIVDAFMAASRIENAMKQGMSPKKAGKIGIFKDVCRKLYVEKQGSMA